MEPLLEGLLRSLGGSEANFLELCFGRFPCGKFHTRATSKKFRPPSGNFRPNPPELPRSPSRSFSSRETGWRTLLLKRQQPWNAAKSHAPRWISDLSFHGCWLGLFVVWRLLWVQLLPLNNGPVEKSSFHGCYRLGTPGGWISVIQKS